MPDFEKPGRGKPGRRPDPRSQEERDALGDANVERARWLTIACNQKLEVLAQKYKQGAEVNEILVLPGDFEVAYQKGGVENKGWVFVYLRKKGNPHIVRSLVSLDKNQNVPNLEALVPLQQTILVACSEIEKELRSV